MKKNVFFSLFVMLGFSLTSFINSDIAYNEEACWIVYTHGGCSTTLYESQYCDEGNHGTETEWHLQIQAWDCEQFAP